MPIQCYKVQVRKADDKCMITSQSLPSFFLYEGGKESLSINRKGVEHRISSNVF